MKKNLLIGNGINLANNNYFLNNDQVQKRFLNVLNQKHMLFKEAVYLKELDFDDIKKSIMNDANIGIEVLAGRLFEYMKNKIEENEKFCWNHCYRLIEIIGIICIESLFLVDEKIKYPEVSNQYIKVLNIYDNILTLNYTEDWDKNNNCIYLHGRIKKYLNTYDGEYIISKKLLHTPEIKKFIPKNILRIDLSDIIFIPDNKYVSKYTYVGEGLFTNKCNLVVYPSSDIFPYGGKGDIYKKFDNLEYLEIFGVSPFGEEPLLKKVSKIKNVIVYVYNKDNNIKEINEWKKHIPHAIFKDSIYFLNQGV